MSVLYGSVDGTGTPDGSLYAKTYYNSLCHRVWLSWESGLRWYLRGPTVDGMDTQERGRKLAEWTEQNRAGKKGIIFAGHSRGGAAAIHAAYLLQKKGIEIDYLFLHDAVNMQTMIYTHYIPENVRNVIHARRDPGARSRVSWGNTGCHCSSSATNYTEHFFYCTHSGVGGVPWQIYYREVEGIEKPDNEFIKEDGAYRSTMVPMKQDVIGSRQAADWALGALQRAKATLEQSQPAQQQQQPKPGNGPGAGVGAPGAGKGGGGGGGGALYTVVSGDSLSAITGRLWGDVLLWPILYDNNKATVGSNPNLIKVGQKLSIPNIKAYSASQLDQARSRGRNWR